MSTPKPKAVVIISGGLDSTTLLYDVVKGFYTVSALSFDYGQRHVRELVAAKASCMKLSVPHTVVDISAAARQLLRHSALTSDEIQVPDGHYAEDLMKITVVPNRNAIFLNFAVGYAVSVGAETVFFGAHTGDHAIYPDCRPEFVAAMSKVARIANWSPIEISAPYIKMSKLDILRRGLKLLNVDYSLTWTCYKGQEKACGKCGTCVERILAFDNLGEKDPLEYEEEWSILVKAARELEKDPLL